MKRKRQSIDGSDHLNNSREISPEFVRRYINDVELKLAKAQIEIRDRNSSNNQLFFERTQKMLTFARDNFKKGFFNTATSCLKLAENYLERCQ